MNHIGLTGNICQEPDLRYTPQGTALCELRLAHNEKYTTSDGQQKEESLYVDVTFWGKKAEVVAEYHQKGDRILVEGKIKMDEWTQDDGQKRSKLEIKGRDFTFIKQRRSDGGGGRGQAQSTAPNSRGNQGQSAQNASGQQSGQGGTPEDGYEVNDDEIPF